MIKPTSGSIWFHFASLGEFEQGRPVLEALKKAFPTKPVVITFFSPSGYEVRKNTDLADAVYYLPLDTSSNARRFIDTVKPDIAIFTKYEYWYHYFNELKQQNVPLYIVSGIFRPEQVFFKWYGSLNRKMLGLVTHFFVQDNASKALLASIDVNNVTIAGDTRFDRVWANAENPKFLPQVIRFKANDQLLVAGSTWPKDETLIVGIINKYADLKFVIAPHEIGEQRIMELVDLFQGKALRYSQIINTDSIDNYRVLIIDSIGILSSVYQYGDIGYIGGGFGVGIHNTLEAAAFGLPVIFGPNYQRFREARELVALGAGFSVVDAHDFDPVIEQLITDSDYLSQASAKAKKFVADNQGATQTIVNFITKVIAP